MTRKIFLICFILSFTTILSDSSSRKDCSYFETIKKTACSQLSTSSGNICTLINGQCTSKKQYTSCADYNSENTFDSTICESIIPSDISMKCVAQVNGNTKTCNEVAKTCSDFNGELNCESLSASSGKHCILVNNKCEEHFKECKDATNNCNSNIPENSYFKCINKGGTCTTPVYCSDYKYDEELDEDGGGCHKLSPEKDKNKACGFLDNKCTEHYINCEDYEGENKNECEAIIPMYQSGSGENSGYEFDLGKKCVYNANEKKCKKETRRCSDYKKGQDEDYCEDAKDNNDQYCTLYGDKCLENYDKCEDYKGNEKEVCENIELDDNKDYTQKCVYEENICVTKPKKCEDAKSKYECFYIKLENTNKRCAFPNNKCTEQEAVHITSTLTGYSKTACEEIIPYKEYWDHKADDHSTKTVYDETSGKCTVVKKTCSEFNYETDSKDLCTELDAENGSQCILFNNKCYKAYSTCEASGARTSETCQNIMLVNYATKKCNFSGSNCVTESRTCDDYKVDNLKESCENILPLNEENKCSYSGGSCSESRIYCSEVAKIYDIISEFNDEICGRAAVSDSKNKCVASSDKSACVEKSKSEILNNHFYLFFAILLLWL